jgi:predicted transcriptional regulator
MKIHSFVRENIPKVLNFNNKKGIVISLSNIVIIKQQTPILKIIGQCDIKHIITLLIKTITSVRGNSFKLQDYKMRLKWLRLN